MKNIIHILKEDLKQHCIKPFMLIAFGLLVLPSVLFAQNKQTKTEKYISGLVRDVRTKHPINAAEIVVPNFKTSAVTDEQGRFRIKVFSENSILRISAYDYSTQEVTLMGRDSVVIDLCADEFSSYYKKVETLTGSVDNSSLILPVKSISNLGLSTAVTADEVLQATMIGDVRGITRSGLSGEGASLFIRGINSLNANTQPLFVVDGVIWNSQYDVQSIHDGFFQNILNNIDVNDIESISVLKDGTSVYGSKGANGVILIKTKRSRSMVTRINVSVLNGVVDQPRTTPMMTGEEFRTYVSDMLGSKGLSGSEVSTMGFLQTNKNNSIYNTYHNSTNWIDAVSQKGSNKSYSINVAGGDEKAMYYLSLGYAGNKGIVKTTDHQRYNARFNADLKMVKNLTLGLNIGFTRNERTLLDDGVNNYTSPTWISVVKSPFLGMYKFTTYGQETKSYAFADDFDLSNPLGVIYNAVNNLKQYHFNIGILPTFKLSPNLSLSSQFDYNIDNSVEGHFDPYLYVPTRNLTGFGNYYNKTSSQVMQNIELFDDTRLTYEKVFNVINHFKAMLGWMYITNYYESDYLAEYNSKSNNKTTITGAYEFLTTTGVNNLTNSLSNYFNAEYNFDNRYFINATASIDGSSRFGKQTTGGFQLFGHSWGVFPSINAGWLISSEKFMKNINFINYCKLRAGFGLTGNDGIQDYQSMTYFSAVRLMNVANGLAIDNIANDRLQWETTSKANVGIDMSVLKDVLSFSVDVYSNKTYDLITLNDFPYVTGLGKYWSNGGTLTNKGIELSATVKAMNFKSLKWELGLSAGHYKNKIISLPTNNTTTSVYDGEVITSVGMPVGVFYGYKTQGVFSTTAEANAANLKTKTSSGGYVAFGAGDVHFLDVVKDGIIDAKDKQVIGDPNPDLYGTISSKITFKHISLNTVFTYSVGNDIYNYYRSQLESGKNLNNQSAAMNARWTAEGQVTSQPKATYNDPLGNARFSDRWIEDGSYLKLKTITLCYDLPLKINFIQGLTVWLSANNLITWTKYLGVDPEVSSGNSVYYQGVDNGLLPVAKSYYLGVKLSL
ncbi:MAG: SusC/RagA family TonB-linked outer membrane protein [Paludibacter sp.]|nr:SusC/RagA family TonB-linked outer membrane protein [Paludibacter sp.]